MNNANPTQKNQQEELLRYARLLWRRKWIVILPAMILPVLTVLYVIRLPDRFRSETLILVQPQKIPDRFVPSSVSAPIGERLQTISQQIFSRTRLEKVIEEFHLFREQSQKRTPEEIVELARRRIDLSVHHKDSFRLAYWDESPRTAMMVTNKLASLFIEENLKVREQQAMGTSQFLSDEIDKYREGIHARESEITAFKRRYLYELPEQVGSNQSRLGQLQSRLQINTDNINGAEDRRIQIQQQLVEMDRLVEDDYKRRLEMRERLEASLLGRSTFPANAVANKGAPVLLPEERVLESRKRDLARLRLSFTERHPDVARLKGDVERLEAEARAAREAHDRAAGVPVAQEQEGETQAPSLPSIERVYPPIYAQLKIDLTTVEKEIARSREQNGEIEKQISLYQARISVAPQRQMELQQLSEDYDNLKAVLDDLINKKLQADMAGNLERKQKGEQFKVLDPANLPEKPFSPNRIGLLLGALAAGLGLGGGVVLAVDLLCFGVKTRNDLRDVLGVPVLGVIPEIVTPADLRKRLRLKLVFMTVIFICITSVAGVVHVKVQPLTQVFQSLATQVRQTHWTTTKAKGGR